MKWQFSTKESFDYKFYPSIGFLEILQVSHTETPQWTISWSLGSFHRNLQTYFVKAERRKGVGWEGDSSLSVFTVNIRSEKKRFKSDSVLVSFRPCSLYNCRRWFRALRTTALTFVGITLRTLPLYSGLYQKKSVKLQHSKHYFKEENNRAIKFCYLHITLYIKLLI